ncbi:hypothetical protein [Alienimonas chondri]|uniref:Type II toxin-antitoxin system HicA family toxin n=1 Tax=Alienimonas chondri TaxID=2681879 RepID=A0ABX1VD70_9PLAN|nr:hypothetical protein [Alienimonas chondri]NNJ26053.1 hypothetical protein [Alienimonas chondri]
MTHSNKHIREAIEYAVSRGWRLEKGGKSSHTWGKLLCPCNVRGGCIRRVYSTPRSPESHAGQIRKEVDACVH